MSEAMMYLAPEEARDRLAARYGIEATPLTGDLAVASDRLDSHAPFKDSSILEDPPEALLDWVALYAYKLADERTDGKTSSSVGGAVSWSTAWPQRSPTARRLSELLKPYLRHTGRVA